MPVAAGKDVGVWRLSCAIRRGKYQHMGESYPRSGVLLHSVCSGPSGVLRRGSFQGRIVAEIRGSGLAGDGAVLEVVAGLVR